MTCSLFFIIPQIAPACAVRYTRKPLLAIYYGENDLSFLFLISDKKAACFALGGALKAREFWTVLKCEIECCTADYCNTQTPTLSRNAITVFSPEGNNIKTSVWFHVACNIIPTIWFARKTVNYINSYYRCEINVYNDIEFIFQDLSHLASRSYSVPECLPLQSLLATSCTTCVECRYID